MIGSSELPLLAWKAADHDERVVFITGDLGFGVVEPFAEKFSNRFVNAGVAEANMTGMAAGMALSGAVVFTYSIANFPMIRCLEQIRNDVCHHNANVKIVAVGGGFSYGAFGPSHHATADLSPAVQFTERGLVDENCILRVMECRAACMPAGPAVVLVRWSMADRS